MKRKGSIATTSVYRKPTNTDTSNSTHPRVLTGIIRNLRDRANNIWTGSSRHDELSHLNKVFQSNGYPKSTIKKVLHAKPRPQPPPSQTEQEQQEKKVLLTPYVRGISEKIKRACHQLRVRMIFRSENTLRKSLMKVKE